MNTQINIALPKEWKKELERLARVFSVEEEKTLTYLDLISGSLWSVGKFISTVGNVSAETIKKYIADQKGK